MEGNVVYVGSKPVMTYVMAIMTGFNRNPDGVVIRARGRAIPTAVDAAEVTRNGFLRDLACDVSIGTEQLEGEEGVEEASGVPVQAGAAAVDQAPAAMTPGLFFLLFF